MFLPPKCCELKNVPQLYYYFIVSFLGPTFGSFEEFGDASKMVQVHYDVMVEYSKLYLSSFLRIIFGSCNLCEQ
jgi:hypothetical protein